MNKKNWFCLITIFYCVIQTMAKTMVINDTQNCTFRVCVFVRNGQKSFFFEKIGLPFLSLLTYELDKY